MLEKQLLSQTANSFHQDSTGPLKLFVYGTLKCGCHNFEKFCNGVLSVENGSVPGRLYLQTTGIPMLQIPPESILASGSDDPFADVALQNRYSDRTRFIVADLQTDDTQHWNWVHGEILTFNDPGIRLPAIDALERFKPEGPSHYQRVLAPVRAGSGKNIIVWLYIAANQIQKSAKRLSGGIWPEQAL